MNEKCAVISCEERAFVCITAMNGAMFCAEHAKGWVRANWDKDYEWLKDDRLNA